mgnify:CR=1 FL=1
MNMRNILTLTMVSFLLFTGGCQKTPENSSMRTNFNELHRPQFHFSPPKNWMNDPNGMVYLDGEYHLFYQHYPEGNTWGPMHWGHAISTDLVHWEHMPIALEPDEHGYIFSGSAVVDWGNTSGLGTKESPAMVAIYTYHDPQGEADKRNDFQTQGIAYSTDKGRTWTKYQNNPVLPNPGIKDFRDPKVSWINQADGSGQWIMALAVLDKISFYSSPNLLDWKHESDFNPSWAAYGGVWECPDLFKLKDSAGNEKWVLLVSINPGGPQGGSATQYFIGDFKDNTFTSENEEILWIDYGADNYAGVTWSNVREEDGRQLFIGWMSNWNYANIVPTEVWRSAMTLPRSLELYNTEHGARIASRPVEELKQLRQVSINGTGNDIRLNNELVEIELTPEAENFTITIGNQKGEKVLIDKKADELQFNRSLSGETGFEESFGAVHTVPLKGLKIESLRIFIDRSSIEIFINEGDLVTTDIVFPSVPYDNILTQGLKDTYQVHYLKSIWDSALPMP